MADPTRDAITARELAEIHHLAQERLALGGAALTLSEWKAVNLVQPKRGGWFAKLLNGIRFNRAQSRLIAARYYNLTRAIGTREAYNSPAGDDYGHTVQLSRLFDEFEQAVTDAIATPSQPPASPSADQGSPDTAPPSDDPTFESNEDPQDRVDIDDRIDQLREQLDAAFDQIREHFPNEEVPVEDIEWPSLDEDVDFDKEYADLIQEQLDELDKEIERFEQDEAAKAADVRQKILEAGDTAAHKAAAVSDAAVITPGRDYVGELGSKDKLLKGWMRVTGPHPCAFCSMLASRGAVYRTEKSAGGVPGGLNGFHPNCHCHVVPVFTTVPAYSERDRYFMDNWEKVQADPQYKPQRKTSNDALNAWRTWLTQQYRKGLVPDQDMFGPARA